MNKTMQAKNYDRKNLQPSLKPDPKAKGSGRIEPHDINSSEIFQHRPG